MGAHPTVVIKYFCLFHPLESLNSISFNLSNGIPSTFKKLILNTYQLQSMMLFTEGCAWLDPVVYLRKYPCLLVFQATENGKLPQEESSAQIVINMKQLIRLNPGERAKSRAMEKCILLCLFWQNETFSRLHLLTCCTNYQHIPFYSVCRALRM